jgi:glycosyltransferase involved in cell wall biosynthesis
MTSASPRLRVAVVARAVAPLHGVGGLERSVRDLVHHLAARDVQISLITSPVPAVAATHSAADPFASPRIRIDTVPYVTFPFANRRGTTIADRSTAYLLFGERAGRAAGRLVEAGRVDVVHGFGASVLGYARRHPPLGAPLVLNPQGLEEFGGTAPRQSPLKRIGYTPLRWAVRRCAKAADCVIATDASLESTVARHLHVPAERMRTIPNGIDVPSVRALAGPADGAVLRQRHRIGAGEIVLLSAGRVEHNKGFDVMADALAVLSREGEALAGTAWRWVLVGGGPFRGTIERQVERLGLARHVIFAGRAPDRDLHAWYEAASVFVHPTRYEGSSLVTLEAMAHGKPIVATRAGGLPDKVRPGENGWLAEPDSPESLADALRTALDARDRWPDRATASRRIVEDEFAWDRLVDRQIQVYREVLGIG